MVNTICCSLFLFSVISSVSFSTNILRNFLFNIMHRLRLSFKLNTVACHLLTEVSSTFRNTTTLHFPQVIFPFRIMNTSINVLVRGWISVAFNYASNANGCKQIWKQRSQICTQEKCKLISFYIVASIELNLCYSNMEYN